MNISINFVQKIFKYKHEKNFVLQLDQNDS